MKVDVLVAEIGSTTTVVNAFNGITSGEKPSFIGQGQSKTTVEDGDVRIGLQNSIENLKDNLQVDELQYNEMFAASSAAGGLKMTVHGLVFDMTARAAKEAALGAGAVIRFVTAGKLRRSDLKKIQESDPNIILIAGGVDYGERHTALDNSEMIAGIGLTIPVIYAGNIENQEEIKLIFEDSNQEVFLVENVYPKIDDLNIEPTRKVIQDAFEKHIIHAPGMEHIYEMVNGTISPTPGSVMNIAKLFHQYVGDVMVIDVGGATTDVHSVTKGTNYINKISTAPEPLAKRTVEGDIGLYVNFDHVVDLYGREKLEEQGFDVDKIKESYTGIPTTEEEREFLSLLTETATLTAVDRHVGSIRYVYGPTGRSTLAEGKDLSRVRFVIGTGGALTHLSRAETTLGKIRKTRDSLKLLPKKELIILLDHDYIMSSLGVLATAHEKAAMELLEQTLRFPILTYNKDESVEMETDTEE
ncbi:glutamate mutase L [Facklamia sp. DSM 111018]|uniref:Glutamate mutase L n=1 Tax=Facklamia lactis TaxID=2749967 RepID=A0ABS0LRM9_9LACT|nr:GlmL-related ornithine degradation protein [Facklamia lactis]MBG9980122.1 glutamate mutase L [Facklamia lactis]MBG9985924.1 glutamate mutase L [Facklamia lactis]